MKMKITMKLVYNAIGIVVKINIVVFRHTVVGTMNNPSECTIVYNRVETLSRLFI